MQSSRLLRLSFAYSLLFLPAALCLAQEDQPPGAGQREGILRAANGPYRANNDLLFYRLDIRVDPAQKTISGVNSIRFRMLADGTRIQIDLTPALEIDKIELDGRPLKYTREFSAAFIDFPQTLKRGREYTVDFYYSGHPVTQGRFGGIIFGQTPSGKPWVTTADEDVGCSTWWPCKDQWRDEPQEGMQIRVAVPNGLMDVSNGRAEGSTDLGNGYTRWDWRVHYPINSYDVALNIADYAHWSDNLGDLTMDFYALPEDVAKAKPQFAQAKGMLEAYNHYFGPYPFMRDGYKLVQVPYAGMEHQSAVAYGNGFQNGYYGHDFTGTGISTRFDFIIIHESGHEYFGNSITAQDRCDMWIHEGWTTYTESLYVEYRWGKADAIKYLNGYKSHVDNKEPIIPPCGINQEPPQDMYFKGALMINTLRSIVDDDDKWFRLLHDFYQNFAMQNITTADVVSWWNEHTGTNLTPFFNQYLHHTELPTLELRFTPGQVEYRWKADEPNFAMPVKAGDPTHWTLLHPTEKWQTMPTTLSKDQFRVATDLYYINVSGAGTAQLAADKGWTPLAFLLGTWSAKTEAGSANAQVAGSYTFSLDLDGNVIARHSTADKCSGPAAFDCQHNDLLYIYKQPGESPYRAVYFDNEGHVLNYDVTAKDDAAIFLTQEQGMGVRLEYQLRDGQMTGSFGVKPPHAADFREYLKWTGTRQ